MKKIFTFGFIIFTIMIFSTEVLADAKQLKIYKKAFRDAKKVKCIDCHVDKLPKKGGGEHDLNAYGLKAQELATTPTKDTYEQLGPFSVDE